MNSKIDIVRIVSGKESLFHVMVDGIYTYRMVKSPVWLNCYRVFLVDESKPKSYSVKINGHYTWKTIKEFKKDLENDSKTGGGGSFLEPLRLL